METIIIIALIGIVIYIFKFFYDRDKMLAKQVDENGGMLLKYNTLVNHFTNDPDAKVTSVTRDSINIKWKGTIFTVEIFILENFSFTKIECKLDFGPHGIHKKNWNYGKNQRQEKMVEDITNFMKDENARIFGGNQSFKTENLPSKKENKNYSSHNLTKIEKIHHKIFDLSINNLCESITFPLLTNNIPSVKAYLGFHSVILSSALMQEYYLIFDEHEEKQINSYVKNHTINYYEQFVKTNKIEYQFYNFTAFNNLESFVYGKIEEYKMELSSFKNSRKKFREKINQFEDGQPIIRVDFNFVEDILNPTISLTKNGIIIKKHEINPNVANNQDFIFELIDNSIKNYKSIF